MVEHESQNKVIAEKLGGRDYLSFSAVSTFQTCPLRFYFRYLAGLPEQTTTSSLAFGAALHCAIQRHFEGLLAGGPPPSLDELRAVYADAWRQRTAEQTVRLSRGQDAASLERLAEKMLSAFVQSDFAKPAGHIIGVEEELRGVLAESIPDLVARVDLLIETPDALVVSDFKTATRPWSREHIADSAAQVVLYGELAKTFADGKPVRLQFAVVTKSSNPSLMVHEVASDPHTVERTKRTVERVWRAIESGIFYPAPSAAVCPTCAFRRQCRAWGTDVPV